MGELVIHQQARRPTTISQDEYEIIEGLFAAGNSTKEVITACNYDSAWYYRRRTTDIGLQNAERKGFEVFAANLKQDLPSAIMKSALGHTVKVRKKMIQVNGGVETVVGIVEEEKYIPPNAATVNLIANQVLPHLKSGIDDSEIERNIAELTDEEIESMSQIGSKLLKNK